MQGGFKLKEVRVQMVRNPREAWNNTAELKKVQRDPGDNGGGVTPVPIPNTEVKPSSADGTAYSFCGRVGRCQDGKEAIQ